MRRILYIIIALALGIMLAMLFNPPQSPQQAATSQAPAPNVVELNRFLKYSNSLAPAASIQTQVDVFPGGLMAAMVPGIIDWNRSCPEDGQGFVILRNVNDGGNPLTGFTTLRTIQIPLASLKSAEFVLVPLGILGKRAAVSHGQIRFLFDPENPVLALNDLGQPDQAIPPITDLVFSWEAWRKPGENYDVIVGMDSGAYALSLRVFSGRQRYLEDILGGRDWFSTPLTLPGGHGGLLELFRVCAVMGDGYGRSTIGRIFDDAKEAWVRTGSPLQSNPDEMLAEWNELQNLVAQSGGNQDSNMMPQEATESYQSLIRSCATMALHTINVAAERLQNLQNPGADQVTLVPMPAIDHVPPWMSDLSHVDIKGLFVRAPHVLQYVRKNKAVVPSNIPGMLAEAGLGAAKNGKVVQIQYGQDHLSPYVDTPVQP